jgi:1,4-dihydroxy-2-naphthoate octaprenyltransferase
VNTQPSLTPLQIWTLAARPKTLPAAAAPVIAGTAVAFHDGVFSPGPALAALLGALLIQIGTNFANDVFDYKKGADTHERLGPVRVTQAGLLKPEQVFTGMWGMFGLAVLVGVYLLAVAGWPVVWIGLFSILAGIAYTGGPFPLGYNGLGDIFVFIFFGLVAVCGTYYVQAGTVSAGAIWAAIPMGLLATAILAVNNLRDVETDAKAGKKTLAVRFGVNGARIEYDLMVGGALLCPVLMWLTGNASPWVLLTWLTLYRAVPLIKLIYTEKGKVLNKALGGTGRMELEFALLLAVGLVLGQV